jgi:hypothetical protein
MSANSQLSLFGSFLTDLKAENLRPSEFSERVRALSDLLAALPARYEEVLLSLLDRLEAGALFTEESCSFSVTQLHESLEMWLSKARLQLVHQAQ